MPVDLSIQIILKGIRSSNDYRRPQPDNSSPCSRQSVNVYISVASQNNTLRCKSNESYSRIQPNNIFSALHKDQTPNATWWNIDWNIRLFADDCIIYRKITNKNNRKVAEGSGYLGGRAAENGMKINPGKSKAIRFTRSRVKNPLGYSLGGGGGDRKRAVVNTWE
jgi:hypothetical protein